MIDFSEHLEEEEALRTLFLLEQIVDRIVVFVPEGESILDKDAYQMGADTLQTHKSTWTKGKLEALGFRVVSWPQFNGGPNMLWGVW